MYMVYNRGQRNIRQTFHHLTFHRQTFHLQINGQTDNLPTDISPEANVCPPNVRSVPPIVQCPSLNLISEKEGKQHLIQIN